MRKLVLGIVIGLVLGAGGAAAQSYMMGWTVTVTTDRGLTVTCEDPFIWSALREIECDGGEIE